MWFLFIVLYLSQTTSFVGNNCSFNSLYSCSLSVNSQHFFQLDHKHPVFSLHLVHEEFLQRVDTVTGQLTDDLVGVDEVAAILDMDVTHEFDCRHLVNFGLFGGLIVHLDSVNFANAQLVLER